MASRRKGLPQAEVFQDLRGIWWEALSDAESMAFAFVHSRDSMARPC